MRRMHAPTSQSTQDSLSPNGPSFPQPRSPSPSSGFTHFLTKPSKWFSRSASTSKGSQSASEPRSSTGSGRKHKISRPTDPRPILDKYPGPGSRSVLDLSIRPPGSMEISRFHAPSTPSSPVSPLAPSGSGDLRNISRKAWSRSADDLSKVSPTNFSPIKASFQERIVEYRNRSGSNASCISPSSATPPSPLNMNGRHPFPTVGTPPPPPSPPRSSTLPCVSISVSAPVLDDGPIPRSASPTHVHTRSHSFTPKLPSKLATPRFPSPQRSRTGSSLNDREFDVRDVDVPPQGTSTRPALSFGFGALNQNKHIPDNNVTASPTSHRATALLPPPTIIGHNPEEAGTESKRSSQIVFHSGFINRLVDVPNNFHQAHLPLSKGWKPFKLELKGSKLYFYKPPSDRVADVKELFPTSLVPPSEEDDGISESLTVDDTDQQRRPKGKEEGGTMGRKKRAYWGRRTHPDLILDANAMIEKGTFEALVHEAVFATTLLGPISDDENEREERRQRWHEFGSSVLLSIPLIIGREAFEPEFLRCCSYLISGADDDDKQGERLRVVWLASEYLRFHGEPVDPSAWDEWKDDTIPDLIGPNGATTSSNINTFSPRPNDGSKTILLLDALFSSPHSHDQPHVLRAGLSPPGCQFPWAALYEEGLSREILLHLDPYLLARSLTLFHRSVLEQCPENLTAEFITGPESRPSIDRGATSTPSSAGLFGSDDQPHWLTKLLLLQILGADTSSGYVHMNSSTSPLPSSPGRRSEDRGGQTSRTHSRSEVISVWARVGELCRMAGDECSWQAISAALCSRPIARLDKVWKRVDPHALAAIEGWAHVGRDGEVLAVARPQMTVWGGDIKAKFGEVLGRARGDSGSAMLQMSPLDSAKKLFEGFRAPFILCPRKSYVSENEISDDIRGMVAFWRDMAAEGGGTNGMAVKFKRLDQFMSLSLAAEPRRKGLFEPHFWSRPAQAQAPYASLVPLLFPEPLPTVTLIERTKLIRGRLDSDASDMQYLRSLDAQLRQEAGRQLQRLDMDQDFTKRLILGQGGTVIPVYNGELLLVVQAGGFESTSNSRPSSRVPSRPPSSVVDHTGEKTLGRSPSIRVKPGSSHGLDRKTSMARRSSLPSVSHLSRQNFVTSEPSSEPPLRVVVRAGTLNNLVNILVHGLESISVSVADDNGEMSLRENMTRELVVDRGEFSRVWWNVFRSFVSPFVFFELLRKIFITSQPAGSSPPALDHLQAASIRNEVLITMKEWLTIGGGAQDILDDPQLFSVVQTFLDDSLDPVVSRPAATEGSALAPIMEALAESKRMVKSTFLSQTLRPSISRGSHSPRPQGGTRGARRRNTSTRDPPDFERMDPEDFVENLDGMACAAFSNVTQEDLYITADLLEVQTSDRTGWFSARDAAPLEELVEIQTIYSHFQEIEPSNLISELSQDALYRLLPPGVRSCIRAYVIIRKWLIANLVAPRLGLRTRQARMELLLQAIEVARLRNAETPDNSQIEQPCVRSFVEAVITSALLSVESRLHHRAWQSVALSRGCSCDSLSALLLRPYIQSTSSRESLTVDMGWLLERMLEIIATPDVIEALAEESQNLVNFDKRRHLCNLISKASCLPSARKNTLSEESNRRGFERLNNIEKEVLRLQFDHRGIKEEAARETANPGMNGAPSSKKAIRPFHKVVAIQVEKNRRDKNLRARLQREKQQEQTKHERRDDLLNKAMRQRKPVPTHKQHRNKKSMSALFSFMRPISSAFGADTPQPLGLKRTASELDFPTTGKPALVLSVMDAQVAQFINNERSYTFQLDTEDGGHYLLQATSKREMTKWLETVSRVTKNAAKRRLTYIGNSPKPQLADHIHHQHTAPSRDPKAVFGVELQFLLHREAENDYIAPGTVPTIIEQCLHEVETRGLTEVGIYRIAGAATEINGLKDAYNRGEYPIKESTDIHAICDLIKSWFRVLPEPVFPPSSYRDVMEAMRQENLDERLLSIRNVVQALPQSNFDILRRVSEHLDRVTDYEEHNHMTAEALAIVFSPNLLRAPQNDFVMILNNMGLSHKLVKALITHFHVIFDEADPEAEAHSEDDLDSPILEEDEEEEEEVDQPNPTHDLHNYNEQHSFDAGNHYTPG